MGRLHAATIIGNTGRWHSATLWLASKTFSEVKRSSGTARPRLRGSQFEVTALTITRLRH
jgi:hypothetical protein